MTVAPGRRVARRYDRIAPVYDLWEAPMDVLGGRRRRQRVIDQSSGTTLEVGIGTGRNIGLYPDDVQLVGIDVSHRMLARARRAAARVAGTPAGPRALGVADVEALPFPDATFDTVTATCVFCSVDDPVQGLREIRRVTRPGGQVLLLEHVRPRNRALGLMADLVSPLTRRLVGPAVNRRTEENVAAAGLAVRSIRRDGIWREIRALP